MHVIPQSIDAQFNVFTEAGVVKSRIITDKNTGSHVKRDGLGLLRAKTQEGDAILATKQDRLGRDTLVESVGQTLPSSWALAGKPNTSCCKSLPNDGNSTY